jgi:hypothetical protein
MAKHGLRRQGCCDGHSPRSVSVLPSELKALVRRNGLKLGHDGFPYRVGTTRIRRWAGFIDEPESSKESRLRAWSVLRQLRSVLSEAGNVAIPPPAQKTFDAEGEALERALTKIPVPPERSDQKSVFLGPPLSPKAIFRTLRALWKGWIGRKT